MVCLNENELHKGFSTWDYAVFCSMLFITAVIGVNYCCKGRKQKTATEFLMADREMGVIPIAFSLLASFASVLHVLSIPVDVYLNDITYIGVGFAYCFTAVFTAYVFLPVFHELEVATVHEYLELRFNKLLRRLAALMFIIQMTVFMAIAMHIPALVLSQITGLNHWLVVGLVGGVSTFYTILGGIKAVMWTNVFHVLLLYGSLILILIKGSADVGGFERVWNTAKKSRLVMQMSVLSVNRQNIWVNFIGGIFMWLTINGVNQTQVQRYLTTSVMKTVQVAIWFNLIGLLCLLLICITIGIVLYTTYIDCDPIATQRISLPDQLLPLYVLEKMSSLPGLPGLFIAALFSTALSTVSSGANALANATLKDFIFGIGKSHLSETTSAFISKIIALTFGTISLSMVVLFEDLGNTLQAAATVIGVTGGPILGLFILGLFFPWANSLGAAVGFFASLGFLLWLAIGAYIYKDKLEPKRYPMSTANCACLALTTTVKSIMENVTTSAIKTTTDTSISPGLLELYKIPSLWYCALAVIIVIIIGMIVSIITGIQDPEELDPDLVWPVYLMCVCIPEGLKLYLKC